MNGRYLTSDYETIAENLKHYAINKEVYKELKEPILYENKDVLIFCKEGFILFNKSKLKILYIKKDHRKEGIGSQLINEMCNYLERQLVSKTIALIPIDKISFYQKNGFKEIKRFVNYIKVEKCWNN